MARAGVFFPPGCGTKWGQVGRMRPSWCTLGQGVGSLMPGHCWGVNPHSGRSRVLWTDGCMFKLRG
eukprot:6507359-Pyramimonas_sp.AAC.1